VLSAESLGVPRKLEPESSLAPESSPLWPIVMILADIAARIERLTEEERKTEGGAAT
jgi:hypothetical protein